LKKITLLLFCVWISSNLFAQEKFTLSGNITDGKTGEELIGATVVIEELSTGASANVYGFYSISLPKGKYNVRYNFLGYESFRTEINLDKNIKKNVELFPSQKMLDEVVITDKADNENVEKIEIGTIDIKMESIKKLPAFLGEVDVLKVVQLLPGVQSGGDGNTGFYVRGGSTDQNLVLLDEAVVYNASHLFNFFSVFNPDAIKDLKLYKGGIPPTYGGRLSSVLDIRMKDGNSKEYKASGGIGLISSRLTVEGPIQKDVSSFLISGRRTYADIFLKLSPDESVNQNQLYFYDLNLKMNYKINDKNRIFISGYFGRDVTGFSDLFGFDWGNATGTVRWNHLFSDRLFSNFSLVYSNYTFRIAGDIGPQSFRWNSEINDLNAKADFTYYLNPNNTLTFGVHSIYHNLDPGQIKASIEGGVSLERKLSVFNALEHGVYVNNEQKLFDGRLGVNYGFRLSGFQVIGDGTRYEFDRSNPLKYQVTDTIALDPWKTDEFFFGFEPRLSLRYTIDETSSIKAGYNRMFQYIRQSQSAQSVAPYDVWYIANNNIPPQRVDQVSLGYFKNIKENKYETSVEVYYKDMQNAGDIVDNGDILGNEFLQGEIRIGKGWSYGAEFLLEKKSGRLNGFLGYTWSRTMLEIPEINDGIAYFAPWDRTHDLSLAGSYQINDKWSFSSNFVYATGRAITLPIGNFQFNGVFAPFFGERNADRLPDYHRLDVSLTWEPGVNKENKRFKSSWNFSVFNVYGRVNPISVNFSEKEGRPNTSFFYIPGPIPSVTWNFNF
jgi:hypothetical protein